MSIATGFYNIKNVFETDEQLKTFYVECVEHSNNVHVDQLLGFHRERHATMTLAEILELASVDAHNVFIDRRVQNAGIADYFEAGFSINNHFLFIFMTPDRAAEIIEKYNLTLND